REDPPTTAEFVLREPGRRALPAEVPPRVADGPAVAALLAVEAEVLALLAHRRRHARERSDHLGLHVAPEAQQLAVRRERSAGRELLADWPTRTIRCESVCRLEEQSLGAVAVGDDEDLVVRPRPFQRRRPPRRHRRRRRAAARAPRRARPASCRRRPPGLHARIRPRRRRARGEAPWSRSEATR